MELLKGVRRFSNEIFPQQSNFFQELAKGQSPKTMMITCSDSRIDPNLMTQTQPGELFILRNAGNIIPPHGSSGGGEEPTIEFAVKGLGVKNIVVCGHSQCGAMAALSGNVDMTGLSATQAWLEYAESTKKIVKKDKSPDLLDYVEMNVLVQIQNLKTYPSVASAIKDGSLEIFGWVYHLEKGDVSIYDTQLDSFVSLKDIPADDVNHFSVA